MTDVSKEARMIRYFEWQLAKQDDVIKKLKVDFESICDEYEKAEKGRKALRQQIPKEIKDIRALRERIEKVVANDGSVQGSVDPNQVLKSIVDKLEMVAKRVENLHVARSNDEWAEKRYTQTKAKNDRLTAENGQLMVENRWLMAENSRLDAYNTLL